LRVRTVGSPIVPPHGYIVLRAVMAGHSFPQPCPEDSKQIANLQS
jgi:hypothetical protein